MDKKLFRLLKKKKCTLILDGAIGGLLEQRKKPVDPVLWTARLNIDRPEEVLKLHKQYINAGADIITTNTFRTNPAAYEKAGLKIKYEKFVESGVKPALDAAKESDVLIAGSNAPYEDCYKQCRSVFKKDLEANHKRHIDALMNNGIDFILNETLSHLDEIELTAAHCRDNGIPFITSIFFKDDLKIFSGEKVEIIIKKLMKYEPLAVGFNCVKPSTFKQLYRHLDKDMSWGGYFNAGGGLFENKMMKTDITPDEYAEFVKSILPKKPVFIGGCCGTTPAHIRKVRAMING